MNVSPVQPHVDASNIEPEQLARNSHLTEDEKIGEVTRQFEAILLRQILQSTQKTVIPSKYADNSTAAGIYHDMATHQLADSISKSGTLGLAQSLKRQLTRQLQPVSMAGHDRQPGSAAHRARRRERRPAFIPFLRPQAEPSALRPRVAPLNTGHTLHPLTTVLPSKGAAAS